MIDTANVRTEETADPAEYVPLEGQQYDPITGWKRNRRAYDPARPVPRCTCGDPLYLWPNGDYAGTCLGEECLGKFLGTNRRVRDSEKKQPAPITEEDMSEEMRARIPALLARTMKHGR